MNQTTLVVNNIKNILSKNWDNTNKQTKNWRKNSGVIII